VTEAILFGCRPRKNMTIYTTQATHQVVFSGVLTTFPVYPRAISQLQNDFEEPARQRRRTAHRREGDVARILLVEDNDLNRDMLARRLSRAGHQILMACDGASGIEMTGSERPDLVLMDLDLPILDGWAATRLIKANPATWHVPVIALTAHAMATDRDTALAAGCDDYDTKPIDLQRLLDKIYRQLDKGRHPARPAA
jgi:CheY-like chemotaxis protein